ncbi:MAG: acyltransferase [Alphaproteobacteria bacterium]|nr:acyltransferase [Alphaproteobacteria bacterium]
MAGNTGGDSGRVAGLDLLRGVAALAVALPHFFAYRGAFPATAESVSALAVEVFFVLSGYVLAPQILLCLGAGQLRYLGVFLVRRWMRTIPPYLVALLAVSILGRQFASADFLRYLTYTQNLFRQSNTADYFAVAWSLSVEEWFYVAFPSLLLAAAWVAGRRDRRFALVFGVGFCLAIATARVAAGDGGGDWGAAIRRVVVYRLDSIGYGFLLYLALDCCRDRLDRLPGSVTAAVLALTALAAFLLLEQIAGTGDRLAELLFPFAGALFGSSAIVCALRAEPSLRRRPALARLGAYLGAVSYPVYLFHIILIEIVSGVLPGVAMPLPLAVFLIALFALTGAFHAYVERPILAARPHYRAPASAPPAGLTAVAPADRR